MRREFPVSLFLSSPHSPSFRGGDVCLETTSSAFTGELSPYCSLSTLKIIQFGPGNF
jgi:hypothetical protein